MFCVNCGQKNEEGARFCEHCGKPMVGVTNIPKESQNNSQTFKNEKNIAVETYENFSIQRTKKSLKQELLDMAGEENAGNVIWTDGASNIAKDLIGVLKDNEKIISLVYAKKASVLTGFRVLLGRYGREYMVCTNQRIIYVEGIKDLILNHIPPFHRTISIPYQEIGNVIVEKRTGIYSGKLGLQRKGNMAYWNVIDEQSALYLKELIESH